MFETLVADTQAEPKDIFKWMYNNVYGNVSKKDLQFMEVLEENFQGASLLGELIDLVEVQKKLSAINAKSILFSIIDGKFEKSLTLS